MVVVFFFDKASASLGRRPNCRSTFDRKNAKRRDGENQKTGCSCHSPAMAMSTAAGYTRRWAFPSYAWAFASLGTKAGSGQNGIYLYF